VTQESGTQETLGAARETQLLAEVDAPDETLRAQAAVALAQGGSAHALEACLRTISDAPEPTHAYSTPAGWALVSMGRSALPGVIDCLVSENPRRRLSAEFVLMQITKRQFGFDGHEWEPPGYEAWARWWQAIGYRHDAPPAERNAARDRARQASAALPASA